MERSRLLECLADDHARLRSVAAQDLTAQVPSCPGWSMRDLVQHVAEVYLHKTGTMRSGSWPDSWPPTRLADEHPIVLLDRAYAALIGEFAHRDPGDTTLTWHESDQTVGFWIRRMAQETVIHRIDAELAAGAPVVEVPDDLAIDGIDEVLRLFVGYGSRTWIEEGFRALLDQARGRTVRVHADGVDWLVRTMQDGVAVSATGSADVAGREGGGGLESAAGAADAGGSAGADGLLGDGHPEADATVSGSAGDVLRWLWCRESSDGSAGVKIEGDPTAVRELRDLLVVSTQ